MASFVATPLRKNLGMGARTSYRYTDSFVNMPVLVVQPKSVTFQPLALSYLTAGRASIFSFFFKRTSTHDPETKNNIPRRSPLQPSLSIGNIPPSEYLVPHRTRRDRIPGYDRIHGFVGLHLRQPHGLSTCSCPGFVGDCLASGIQRRRHLRASVPTPVVG